MIAFVSTHRLRLHFLSKMSISVSDINTGIVEVRLNRPRKLNAIDNDTILELDRVFGQILPPLLSKINVVVLTGSGDRAFTAGLDLSCPRVRETIFSNSSPDSNPAQRASELKQIIDQMQSPILRIATFPRPIICAINGICFGLGVDLACACDIRIASDTAQFSVREIKIGICADLGSLFFLPRIARNDSWVREICMTGRIFNSQEALTVGGFISEMVPSGSLGKRAHELALSIASNPQVALEGIKKNLNKSNRQNMHECFDYVSVWNSAKLQDTQTITECVGKLMRSSSKL